MRAPGTYQQQFAGNIDEKSSQTDKSMNLVRGGDWSLSSTLR